MERRVTTTTKMTIDMIGTVGMCQIRQQYFVCSQVEGAIASTVFLNGSRAAVLRNCPLLTAAALLLLRRR